MSDQQQAEFVRRIEQLSPELQRVRLQCPAVYAAINLYAHGEFTLEQVLTGVVVYLADNQKCLIEDLVKAKNLQPISIVIPNQKGVLDE